MEEYENVNNEYEPIDMGSTEYWQEEWKKEKEAEEEKQKMLNEEVDLYFKCNNQFCGNVVNVKCHLKDVDDIIIQFRHTKCKKCQKYGFKQINKKTYDKLKVEFEQKEKKKKSEKIDIEKLEKVIKENIADDVKDLIEDLTERLLDNKISSKNFVHIFCNLAEKITIKYYKDLPGGVSSSTFTQYKRNFLELCSFALDRLNIQEDAQNILDTYKLKIEENENYLIDLINAEEEYFIYDVKDAVLTFDKKEYENNLKNAQNNLFSEQLNMELEENYQKKLESRQEKISEREKRRELRRMLA